MVHVDHDGEQIKLCISLIRISMHESTAAIENEALFFGTGVILGRSVSPGLKLGFKSHIEPVTYYLSVRGKDGDRIYASANFI